MKKPILITLILSLFLCSVASSKILIDWTGINGVIRATVTNYHTLLAQTNAYKNDFYFVAVKISNYPAGVWQAKKNSPKVATNWRLIHEEMGTNFLHSFPGNQSAWSNVVMTAYTNAFANVQIAQRGILSNTLNIAKTNGDNTLGRRISAVSNTGYVNRTNSINTLTTEARAISNTLIMKMTNLINVKGTAVSNSVLKLTMTNAYSGGFLKLNQTNTYSGVLRSSITNLGHLIFTNILSVQNTNRITVRNYDHLTNWLLYVSNQQVKVKKK
jgi:hypothetical protein